MENLTTIQTSHKTFNKTLKRQIVSISPNTTSFKTVTVNYKKHYLVKEGSEIIAIVKKGGDIFKGLVILPQA